MSTREAWTPEEEGRLRERPYDFAWFDSFAPGKRTRKAFQIKREMLGITRDAPLTMREGTDDSPVFWDKRTSVLTWDDFIDPMERMQSLGAAASRSQDYSTIVIPTDAPIAIAFVSDWHVGSWGVEARGIREATERILRLHREHNLYAAILGDMLEMAIRLRSVAEMGGNLLRPDLQLDFQRLWLETLAPAVLWSVWDNHTVQREEEATGHSAYADLFKSCTIYHSGIGHTALTVGDQEYLIATSHRFRGRSKVNPLSSQMAYMRDEAPEVEVAVAGDSHVPAIMQYFHGGRTKTAANCGTLQTNSTYTKRHFSLTTSEAMPVLVFHPDSHLVTPYHSLDHYESAIA